MERGDWPKSGGSTDLEKYLARQISHRGGQTKALLYDLDAATRHYLTTYGSLPAAYPFSTTLMRLKPHEPGALSLLRSYVRRYERGKDLPKGSIIDQLIASSPDWRSYFATHDRANFEVADMLEVNFCLDALRKLKPAPSTGKVRK